MKKPITKGLSVLLILMLVLTSLPVIAGAETLHPTGALPDSWETIISHLAPPQAIPPSLPTSVDLTSYFPSPGNQGSQGSCTAWAVAYGLKTMQEQVKRNWGVNTTAHQFSPGYVYNQINSGSDNGSHVSDAMALIVNQGVCTLATFPYNQSNWTAQPTTAQRNEAALYKAQSWNTILGTDAIKARLAGGDGVVISIAVYPDFDAISSSNQVYDVVSGSSRGGHTIALVGYDDSKQAYKFMNSWGTGWGLNGYGWIAYSMLNDSRVNWYGVSVAYVMTNTGSTSFTVSYDANGGAGAPASQTNPTYITTAVPSTAKAYTITYNVNGGNAVSPTSKSVACSFRNWNTNSAGTGTSYNSGAAWPSGTSATLYAQWNNPTAGTLPTPTRSGYNFAGWFTAASGGSQVTSATTITANTTIYAQWTTITGTPIILTLNTPASVAITNGVRREIRFTASAAGVYNFESTNRNGLDPTAYNALTGGSVLDDDSGTDSRNYKFQVSLTAGQTYVYYSGFYGDVNSTGTYTVTVSPAPVVLTLNVPATVAITNGGRREVRFTAPSAGTYKFESSNRGTLDPTSYTALTGGSVINDDSGPDGRNYLFQTTLTAGQTYIYYSGLYADSATTGSYTVTVTSVSVSTYYLYYDANGGAGAPATQTNPVNVTTATPSTPKAYTIIYNANGGSVSPASKTVSCSFASWNTNAAGTGTSYALGAVWPLRVNTTLYAQWSNPAAGALAVPTRSGYTFIGWFTAASGGSQVTTATTITANTTIYAQWQLISTSITLSLNVAASVAITNGVRREMRFTAPAAGTYNFESTNRGTLDPTAYTALTGGSVINDDGGTDSRNYKFQVNLTAGQTYVYYSGLYGDVTSTGTYTVTATLVTTPITLTINTPASVAITSGGRREVRFTAPAAGVYNFESTNRNGLDPTAYNALIGGSVLDDDSGTDSRNYKFQVSLSSGQTYVYYSGLYSDANSTGTYTVTVSLAPITLTLNTAATVAITNGGRREVRFTASAAGTYEFESSNRGTLDPKAYTALTAGSALDDDSGPDGRNYKFRVTLSAGQTYVYYSGLYADSVVSGSYSVTARRV